MASLNLTESIYVSGTITKSNYFDLNVEKIRIYLAPKNFLDNVKEKVKPTEDEIKQAKRNKRRFEGKRMRYDLMDLEHDETADFDDIGKNRNINQTLEHKDSKFEDNLHKFLGLDNMHNDIAFSQPSSRSHFEDSESVNTNNFLSLSVLNKNKVMPIEEKKVIR